MGEPFCIFGYEIYLIDVKMLSQNPTIIIIEGVF
jgi:hypothetical protein